MKKRIARLLLGVYGWGIMACLFIGGMTVFGYLFAIFIGGETATIICAFIYKKLFMILFYASDAFVLLGLVSMYLSGQSAMILQKKDLGE